MNPQTHRILLILASFVLGLLLCFGGILWLTGGTPGSMTASAPSTVGGPFKLTDQDGKPVSNDSFRGKPYLVFFGFTHCPDVCPTTLFEVSEIMRSLGKDADKTAARRCGSKLDR